MDPGDVVERAHRALHVEHVAYLGHLMNDEERAEFMGKLGEMAAQVVAQASHPSTEDNLADVVASLVAMAEYVESWRVSVLLALSPEWEQQVAESRELWEKHQANPDLSKLATIEDLRLALGL